MRLVFLLYAEDRDLLSTDPVYANFYSVTGLFERLRADAGRYPDTMDQRYGAWAQLLTLFRMIYDGGRHGGSADSGPQGIPVRPGPLQLPRRPARGRRRGGSDDKPEIPHVSDGVVYRVLQNLLILDGERLSYRTLDVEQIGSVYETMMGFNLRGGRGPVDRHQADQVARCPGHDQPGSPAGRQAGRPGEVAQRADRPEAHRPGRRRAEEGRHVEDLLAALEKKIAWQRHAQHRAQGGDGPPAVRRAAAQRFALHAAVAHRADRPHHAPSDPGTTWAAIPRPSRSLS